MTVLNLILNCAGLLLWLNWWSRGLGNARPSGIALVSTLRRAEPARRDRWMSPAALAALLVLRAILYWQIGPTVHWVPRVSLGAVSITFRSDSLPRVLVFSVLSFAAVFAALYSCVLFMSALNGRPVTGNPWRAFLRALLGPLDHLPAWLKFLLPFLLGAAAWIAVAPVLGTMGVLLPAKSFIHLAEQSLLIGVSAVLVWKIAAGALLVLHVLNSHVYLGNAALWDFITDTTRGLLRPLAAIPLRVGRFDLAPVLVLALIFGTAEFIERWLPKLFGKLPL
jgi:uncharacterized protein YggT (Ycf19 family)